MNEFLKIKWRNQDISDFEQTCFISDEVISQSYVYKQFNDDEKLKEEDTTNDTNKILHATVDYVPGSRTVANCCIESSISPRNQEICLQALKLLYSRKSPLMYTASEKQQITVYNDLKSQIAEEYVKYNAYVKSVWNKSKLILKKIRPTFYNYLRYNLQLKFNRCKEYSQYFEEVAVINMLPNEYDSTVDIKNIVNVLEMGTLARFALPNLTVKCTLNINTIPTLDNAVLNSKLPVSQDENIERILQNHKIDFVISSSGLKRLLDDKDSDNSWIIPILIQNISVEEEGVKKSRKVIFIDKPLPKTNPDLLDMLNYGYKRLIKSNFCQYNGVEFIKEIPLHDGEPTIEGKCEVNTEEDPNQIRPAKRKIHHNVSYRIWNLKKESSSNALDKHYHNKEANFNILVRCKLDACMQTPESNTLQPIIVRPKIELQLQYGATVPSKSDLNREWCSLFFRPYSSLYRVRIHSPTSEVVAVDQCSFQSVVADAMSLYNYSPHANLRNLQQIFTELQQFVPGEYILHYQPKNQHFISVKKACNSKTANCLDLHELFDNCKVKDNINQSFLPIDVNYILPIHESNGQLPGLFKPTKNKFIKRTKGAKKKKRQQRTKKFQNRVKQRAL